MPKKKLELVESSKPRLYCGKSDELPEQYDDFGEPYDCLQKGFGAGRASGQENNKGPKKLTSNEVESMATVLSISLKTAKGRKSTKTLIQNIIRVLESL